MNYCLIKNVLINSKIRRGGWQGGTANFAAWSVSTTRVIRWIQIQTQVLGRFFMSRWRSLHRARLNRSWVTTLPRVSPWIHFLNLPRSPGSIWTLLFNIKLILSRLKLILFVERVLPYLLILWVETVKILVSLMEEIDHSRSHTAASSVTGGALVNCISCAVLRDELLNVSFALTRCYTFSSSRYAR